MFLFISFRFVSVCVCVFFSLCFCYFVFILAHNFDVSYFFKIELVMLFIVACNQPAADCCWKLYRTCYIKYPIEHTSIRSFFFFFYHERVLKPVAHTDYCMAWFNAKIGIEIAQCTVISMNAMYGTFVLQPSYTHISFTLYSNVHHFKNPFSIMSLFLCIILFLYRSLAGIIFRIWY